MTIDLLTPEELVQTSEPCLVAGRHMSNAEIAAMLDMHHTAISRLRSGNRAPTFDTMNRIVERFGLPDPWIAKWLRETMRDGAKGSARFLTAIWG